MSTLTDDDLTRLLEETAGEYDVPPHGPAEVLAALAEVPASRPLVRRRWVQLSAAAAVLVVALSAAIGALQSGDSGSSGIRSLAGKDAAAPAEPGGRVDAAGGGSITTGTLTGAPQRSANAGGSAAATSADAGAPAPVRVGAPVVDGDANRVVKTGSIALVARDGRVGAVVTAVNAAAAAQGGYIASSNDTYGDVPSAEVAIRVPVDHYDALVAKIRSLDAKVRTATSSGKDVTAQYADISAQLRTLKATRDRFLVILSRTRTISEILTVQQRVDDVSGQIDRLEGARKLLASQSDLSTLSVTVTEADAPVVLVDGQPDGFRQAVSDAKDGFVTGIEAIVRHSGRALVWVLAGVLFVGLGRIGWRVARRRLV